MIVEKQIAEPGSECCPVRVEWLRELSDIARLEQAWRTLETQVVNRMIFSTFDFIKIWYQHHIGVYGTPLLGVAWRGNQLVGLAPLFVRLSSVGKIPLRTVVFAGYDSEAGEFLLRDGDTELAGIFIASLAEIEPFDLMRLGNMAEGSNVLSSVQYSAKSCGFSIHLEDYAYAIVDLKNGYEGYLEAMGRNFRRNFKRMSERVMTGGGGDVCGARFGARPPNVEEAVERSLAIEAQSWKARERGEPLAEHHRRFISEVARRFCERDMVDLPILVVGGEDAAFLMALVERSVYYDFTISYSERFRDFSPGIFLMILLLQELPARGIHTIVSHGPHAYKKRWATRFQLVKTAYVFGRGPRARLARFNRFIIRPWIGKAPRREWEE